MQPTTARSPMGARSAWGGLLVLLALSAGAAAGPRGPAYGNNRYQTEIRTAQGLPDLDDYTSSLVMGEKLTVSVSVKGKEALRPTLTLLRPDGSDAGASALVKKGGRLVAIRGFEVDESGPWTVRVGGAEDTEGTYTVSFSVRSAKPLKVKNQRLGGAQPLERAHAFAGVEGGLLDLTVRFRKGDSPVDVRTITDPSGDDVPGALGPLADDVVRRRTKAQLRGAPLATGDGAYGLAVGISSGEARYSVFARVRVGTRPRGRRIVKLSPDEPFLVARSEPVRGVAGRPVRLAGGGFSADPLPLVLFGGVPAAVTAVDAGGGGVVVVPPDLPEGSTVEVAVVNPDGQAAVADAHFHYARPPEISGIARADGSSAIGGDTAGAQTFLILGAFLHPEQTVLFDAAPASLPIDSPRGGELAVVSPPHAAGTVLVTVRDPYGRTSTNSVPFEFKPAPGFAAEPYAPPFGPELQDVLVTVSGSGFLESDELLLDGEPVSRELVDAATLRFTFPASALGEYRVAVRDRVGSVIEAPVFAIKDRPLVSSVAVVGGTFSGTDGVPLLGGALVEAHGSSFHALDTVTVAGTSVTVIERTFTSFRFVSPAGGTGSLDVTVTDAAAQSVTFPAALRRTGFSDATSGRLPSGGVVDDLSAWRGALGDLDGDGREDDLVLVSYGLGRDNVYRGARTPTGGVANSPGLRAEYTRVWMGDANGFLAGATATSLPAAGSDDWNAAAVALGDLDGGNGVEIVIGGVSPDYTTINDVRIFTNDGSGNFTHDAAAQLPADYFPAVYAYDETGQAQSVFSPVYAQGMPTSLALGDIDRDGDADVIVGRDFYDQTYAYIDPAYVDFTQTPFYVYSGDANTYLSYTFYYYSATKVFVNPGTSGAGWTDDTANRMPSVGDSNIAVVPAFHARDVALGDIDGDTYPDLVVAWDDPLTVTPYGLYSRGADAARVATRILVNDRSGTFTDQTSTWLPAGVSPEFWQAHRVALADLDADGDADLVLLLERSVDAFLGTPTTTRSALRILRNDGAAFVDVTATAVPGPPSGSNDKWHGGALAVRDVDGDGRLDILVGTRTAPRDGSGATRATRLLLGGAGLTFRHGTDFLPSVSVDSGEADDFVLGDLTGSGATPTLLRLSEVAPATSPRGDLLRAADWKR